MVEDKTVALDAGAGSSFLLKGWPQRIPLLTPILLMMKEWNVWNDWYFIQQFLVNLYVKRDADQQIQKQMFIYTDGQHV